MGTLFPTLVYSLCFATSGLCAFLLGRSFRQARSRMLFWSAICFALLALVNGIVILDMLILPEYDFRSSRLLLTVAAIAVLLFGFIWDEGA
jgi:cytochrome b subunit of formate dehydrogenase